MAQWDNQKVVITFKPEIPDSTLGSSCFPLVFIKNLIYYKQLIKTQDTKYYYLYRIVRAPHIYNISLLHLEGSICIRYLYCIQYIYMYIYIIFQ